MLNIIVIRKNGCVSTFTADSYDGAVPMILELPRRNDLYLNIFSVTICGDQCEHWLWEEFVSAHKE